MLVFLLTYVRVKLFCRIYAQGRYLQDMILIGLTCTSGDAAQQEISWSVGLIAVRLFGSHTNTKGKHPFLGVNQMTQFKQTADLYKMYYLKCTGQ